MVTSADFGWNMHQMFKTAVSKEVVWGPEVVKEKDCLVTGCHLATKPRGKVREVGRGWIGTEG